MKPDWRRLLEQEAERQGMTLDGYLSCRFFYSEIAVEMLRHLVAEIRKEGDRAKTTLDR